MITLREAREKGALSAFVQERSGGPIGNAEAVEQTIRSMAGTSKEAPEASSPPGRDD